jgi:cell division protein FtsL
MFRFQEYEKQFVTMSDTEKILTINYIVVVVFSTFQISPQISYSL